MNEEDKNQNKKTVEKVRVWIDWILRMTFDEHMPWTLTIKRILRILPSCWSLYAKHLTHK